LNVDTAVRSAVAYRVDPLAVDENVVKLRMVIASRVSPRPKPTRPVLKVGLDQLEIGVLTEAGEACTVVVGRVVEEVSAYCCGTTVVAIFTHSSIEITCDDGQTVRFNHLKGRVQVVVETVLVAVGSAFSGRVCCC
jgi:hypothetical protein